MLNLAHGLSFNDLYHRDGLLSLDGAFLQALAAADSALQQQLVAARANPDALAAKQESELLIALAPHVDDFVGGLFGIGKDVQALSARHNELAPLYSCKRLFVQRKALHKYKADAAAAFDGAALNSELAAMFGGNFSELTFAQHVTRWLENEEANADAIDLAQRYAAWAVQTPAGRKSHAGGVLFKVPHKLDMQNLVPLDTDESKGYKVFRGKPEHLRHREGFKLTDHGTDLVGALDQAHYCIWCHEQGKDSCSKGLKEKGASGKGVASFKKSPFGVTLAGCPLEEKISEFHKAKTEGHVIGALAVIIVDNPMLAATGHRICNDCMKACIYQKQEPVNIPEAETSALTTVLGLPWGVEIYGLLTRWNPLNVRRPYALPYNGCNVLVVGLGPAGYTLAHYLSNEGFGVVGVDGLKIEPLPAELTGTATTAPRPVRDWQALYQPLDARVQEGFGGVSEYGITVRWDKNFLTLLHLTLARRRGLTMFGGIRFGGTLPIDEAWSYGFHHVAIATGAGRPTIIDLKNNLIRGIRKASDFLMGLQLTGAFRRDTLANMQVRLPAVVIGGGLTAVDTATELMAYYPVQVEKMLTQHEGVVAAHGERDALSAYDEEERAQLEEFLAHGRAIRAERARAAAAGEAPNFVPLLRQWGGVTLAYQIGRAHV